jgi:hypothetical protein
MLGAFDVADEFGKQGGKKSGRRPCCWQAGLGNKTYKVSEELKRLRLIEAGIVMKIKALS